MSICNIFADGTPLFSKVLNLNKSLNELDMDSNQWVFQWKLQCNPDINNQALEGIFLENRIIMCILLLHSLMIRYLRVLTKII